jgi:hypothetical protein
LVFYYHVLPFNIYGDDVMLLPLMEVG